MLQNDKITQLLNGTYQDPDGLGRQRVTTRSLVIASSLAGMERDLVKALDKFKVGNTEKDQLLGALGPMKGDIVEKP